MHQRILVPLDGSKLAERVLPYVRPMALAFGSRIELLQTFDPARLTMERVAFWVAESRDSQVVTMLDRKILGF